MRVAGIRLLLVGGVLGGCVTLNEEELKEDEVVSLGSRAEVWCGIATRVRWECVLESMVAKLCV